MGGPIRRSASQQLIDTRSKSCLNTFRCSFVSWALLRFFCARLPATPSDVSFESRNVFLRHARFLGWRPTTPHTRKVVFLHSVQMVVRLLPRPSFRTAVAICVVISCTFCDFILTQNTSVFNLWTLRILHSARRLSARNTCDSVLVIFVKRSASIRCANNCKPSLRIRIAKRATRRRQPGGIGSKHPLRLPGLARG